MSSVASTERETSEASPAEISKNTEKSECSVPFLYSICRVSVTQTAPDHSRPWVKERSLHKIASGFVVTGRLILTNAHCISYATVVKVQRHLSDQKFVANVLRVCYDCDVAVLEVKDEDFWMMPDPSNSSQKVEIPPMQFGGLPELQDTVRVVGYPLFGTEISITQGVVSRIQLQTYAFSNCELLSVQTDGSVNPGNSGGPVLNADNLVVGIAFQSDGWDNTTRVGEFIPYLVFERVLNHDIAWSSCIIRFAGPAFWWQDLESPAMRRYLGMSKLEDPNTSGIYITEVQRHGSIASVLKEGDCIVAVEDLSGNMISIDNEGTIPFRSFRVQLSHLFTSRLVGETIKVGIVRAGQRVDVSWVLDPAGSEDLVPRHDKMIYDGFRDPEYIIIGGLVFVSLNSYSLNSEWDENCPSCCVALMRYHDMYGVKRNSSHEVVILSQVLDASVNVGYEGVRSAVLEKFNGVTVNSLAHLAKLWSKCSSEFAEFGLNGLLVILDRQEALESEKEILATHGIPESSRIRSDPDGEDTGTVSNLDTANDEEFVQSMAQVEIE